MHKSTLEDTTSGQTTSPDAMSHTSENGLNII